MLKSFFITLLQSVFLNSPLEAVLNNRYIQVSSSLSINSSNMITRITPKKFIILVINLFLKQQLLRVSKNVPAVTKRYWPLRAKVEIPPFRSSKLFNTLTKTVWSRIIAVYTKQSTDDLSDSCLISPSNPKHKIITSGNHSVVIYRIT